MKASFSRSTFIVETSRLAMYVCQFRNDPTLTTRAKTRAFFIANRILHENVFFPVHYFLSKPETETSYLYFYARQETETSCLYSAINRKRKPHVCTSGLERKRKPHTSTSGPDRKRKPHISTSGPDRKRAKCIYFTTGDMVS